MASRSSIPPIAGRVLVCLVTLLVLGGGTVGIAATAATATDGSPTLAPDAGSLETDLNETTGILDETVETTTDTLDGTTNETTDAVDETVENTTDGLENATNETTDGLEDPVENTTDGLENATDETTDVVDETVDDTTDAIDDSVDETTDAVDETTNTVNETVGGTTDELENGTEATALVALEVGANITTGANSTTDANGSTTAEGRDGEPPAGGEGGDDVDGEPNDDEPASDEGGDGTPALPGDTDPGTDAVLVGLLGAITAAGAAGAAGAGAGAGTGAATSTAGGASGLTASLASQVSQANGFRFLRHVASLLPWKLLSVVGYSRYDDSDPLENDRRRAIYDLIRDEPGCYLSEVSDRCDVSLSTVRHHVRVLEEEGLITAATIDGKRRYVASEEADDVELHAALAQPAKREVLEALAACGSAPNGRLADELERDPSTVSHHLSTLADDGLVVRERDGRSMVNELAPAVETVLRESADALEDADELPSSAPSPADD